MEKNEKKFRIYSIIIGLLILSTAYFLTGDWRKEYHEGGGFTPHPVFEFDVYKKNICTNCPEGSGVYYIIDSNLVSGLIGMSVLMCGICPFKYC